MSLLASLLAFIVFSDRVLAALTFGSGVYTNLCGSGTEATSHDCSGACNIDTGVCSSSGPFVVKYTCNGSVTDCRADGQPFASSYSLSGTACNTTVQIDVFSKNCDSPDGWACGDGDLKDYIVWYSGSCGATPTPTPTVPPVATPTPTPILTPTPKVTPTPTPVVTPTPTQTPGPGGGGGGGGGGPAQAPVSMFSRCDLLTASSGNNTTAPSNVIFNVSWTETKSGVNRYRFWYGDGRNEETDVPIILHRYEDPGRYHASVEIRDSEGNWKSSDNCATEVVLSQARRPKVLAATGAPTAWTVFSFLSGIVGLGLLAYGKLISKVPR